LTLTNLGTHRLKPASLASCKVNDKQNCVTNSTSLQCLSKLATPDHELNISGLFFLIIPTITVLGNSMVIIAVLRFKTLHSAINFLIFGLAVADLLVGLFVMPYAVYVHVQGGYWFLGSMMCDIYSASDVACSTASILILTVISFDRYRAVTHPISYSHNSHDTKRVIFIMAVIWVISLALASPMVLGVNIRPTDADPYECRFYNPIFSISSSIISFVIPCFIVLFVYIRIMIALRQRQKLSRKQRWSYLRPLKRLAKETTAVSNFNCSGQKAITGIVETAEITKPQLTVDPDKNELNLGKGRKKKQNDTLDMVSKITTLYSHKINKEYSKNGMQKSLKQYDGCGMYMNRIVNGNTEIIKIDDSDISNEEISSKVKKSFSEGFLLRMLEGLNWNNLPCPCREVTLSRFLQNDSESKYIFVPQLEDERDKLNDAEQDLFTNANAKQYIETVEQEEKEKYDKQQKNFENENECRGMEDIRKESGNLDKAVRKTLKKCCILSSFRKKNKRRKLLHLNSNDSKNSFLMERTSTVFRRTLNRGNSLIGRHCSRSQRMEKRATKTLGIVVGIFLACWVPFFSVYILNAVCIQMDIKSCQVDFYAFFYTTWLGYINSCINPVIYTIFNVEFRRAFKCILFGKLSIRKDL
uniref:G_PROTEIN_RECEP_F1_2 domain-containing protein n=1 Tax=Wuchereria bancrofti TaxID=6293 RepID=A0A1I8F007_WUCBA